MKKKPPIPNKKEDITLISLRMPNDLLNKIKDKAEKENRSLSNMIITALKEIFK